MVVGSLWELLPIPRSAALCQGGWTLLRPHLGSPASCPVKGRDREAGVSTTCLFSSVPLGYHGSSPCPTATVPLPSVHSSCHRCYWLPWLLLVLQTQETTDPFLPCLQPERHTPRWTPQHGKQRPGAPSKWNAKWEEQGREQEHTH